MSLDVYLIDQDDEIVYQRNITHNLGAMALAAGFYTYMWRPEEAGCSRACEILGPICTGLLDMKARPAYYKTFDANNGWGTYEQFLPWLEDYVAALEAHPRAKVRVQR